MKQNSVLYVKKNLDVMQYQKYARFHTKVFQLKCKQEKTPHVKNEQRTQKNYKFSRLESEAFS